MPILGLGIILLILGWLLPGVSILSTIGYILVVVGIILLLLSVFGVWGPGGPWGWPWR